MADTTPVVSSEPSTPPSSAAEQARIRKERREAKIKAGGSARLNKITGLGGGIQRDQPPQPAAASAPTPNHATADPEGVDISQHYNEPASTARPRPPIPQQQQQQQPEQQLTDEQLRAMMLGFPSSGNTPASGTPPPGSNPFASFLGMGPGMGPPDAADNPMLNLLQRMMGGASPGEGRGGVPSFPGMSTPMPDQAGGPGAATADPHAYLWRILHAVFALALGLYIAFTAEFTGTKLEREMNGLGPGRSGIRFFYVFATAEVLLQTSRFFLERGAVQQGGILGMVIGFLPEPWKGYLALMVRYGRIWTTVSGDAMVCVFVLGVCSWLRTA